MADKALKDVLTPDLGIDHPVPIAEVFVSVGDRVRKEDPLLSLESEKAVMDIPSPFDGTIEEILVEADQEIESGTLIMRLAGEGDSPEPPEAESDGEEETASPPVPEKIAPAEFPELPPPAEPESSRPSTGPTGMNRPAHASPSVRLYARELGVDLSRLNGTGPKNRIRREDVQEFVKALASGSGTVPGGSALPPFPYADPAQFGPVREEKLTGIQKVSSVHLHASWVHIPHVTHYEKADITELESWRRELNGREKKRHGTRKYTTLAFVIKALTSAVEEFPRFNSVMSPEGDRVIFRDYVNVGIAVDTPKGLLVPVIRDTDLKGIGEIADEIVQWAAKGREGKLRPDDMQGAGITVTNLGGIGGTAFTPIINPPEVAILGLSRAVMEPVWNGSEFEPKLMLPLSLSYDHRVIDGALAAAFASRLALFLGDLRNTLL